MQREADEKPTDSISSDIADKANAILDSDPCGVHSAETAAMKSNSADVVGELVTNRTSTESTAGNATTKRETNIVDGADNESIQAETVLSCSQNVIPDSQATDTQSTNQSDDIDFQKSKSTEDCEMNTCSENSSKNSPEEKMEIDTQTAQDDAQSGDGDAKKNKDEDKLLEESEQKKEDIDENCKEALLIEQVCDVAEPEINPNIAQDVKASDCTEVGKELSAAAQPTKDSENIEKEQSENEKDDVSDDDTVSYHSEDLIINEQTGDLQLREDKGNNEQDLGNSMEGRPVMINI